MKKFLSFILCLFLPLSVFAGLITFDPLTSDSVVTYNWFNDSYSTIYNEFNGAIESANINDGTLTDADLATAIKMANWYDESLGDWTYSGMLPATDTDLTSDISAGTSYVDGARIVTAATAKTYTASKDTYVYIDSNGAFQYQEVSNGAAQPSDPANSLILAKVVTNATLISSVTDLRQTTPPNLRVYQDLKDGLVISRDPSAADTATIGRGSIEFGSSVTSGGRRNTSQISVDLTTSGRGGLDTGSEAANTYYYIYAIADDDNTTKYEGIASTSATDATGVTGERLAGWVWVDNSTNISPDSVGAYKGQGGDAPNVAKSYSDLATRTIAITTNEQEIMIPVKFYSSGRPVVIYYSAITGNSGGSAELLFHLSIDSAVDPNTRLRHNATGTEVTSSRTFKKTLSAGTHTIEMKVDNPSGNAVTEYGWSVVVEEK